MNENPEDLAIFFRAACEFAELEARAQLARARVAVLARGIVHAPVATDDDVIRRAGELAVATLFRSRTPAPPERG